MVIPERGGWIENLMLTGKGIHQFRRHGRNWLSVMYPVHKIGTQGFTLRTGSKRARQGIRTQIWVVNAHTGSSSFRLVLVELEQAPGVM